MKTYRVKQELMNVYAKRETRKKMKTSLIGFSVFLILMYAFSSSYGVQNIIMPPLSIFFVIILGVIYVSSASQIMDIIKLTTYTFSDEFVAIALDKTQLNLMNKIGVSRIENKYGAKFNQTINFSELASTTIDDHSIIFKSKTFDPFTSNGKITIPKELEKYDTLRSEIKQHPEKYNLTST